MKYIITILTFVFTVSVFGQKIDYSNFDKKLFEKTLFDVLNERRVNKGVEKLVWSNVLYKEASSRNMKIILKKNSLHHPDYSKVWDSLRVRQLLAKESDKMIGGKTSISEYSGPFMTYCENVYWGTKSDVTYRELAESVINSWEKSTLHNSVQYASYINSGKPGIGSCTVGLNNKNEVYVIFNFVLIYRE